jgi:D-alanyl-D-alanine carboxypeptidase
MRNRWTVGLAGLVVVGLVSVGTAYAQQGGGSRPGSAALAAAETYAGDAAVGDDRLQTTQTGWWAYSGVDPATLADRLSANGARLTSLTVDPGSSPVTFTATMVRNTGAYATAWWWYVGQTANQVTALFQANHARLISAERYWTGSAWLFAVVMVANPTNLAWGWWYGDATTISAQADSHHFRITRLQSYVESGAKRFVAVMVSNSGVTGLPWWGWWYGVTASTVSSYLGANHAQLLDIRRNGDGTFDVVLARSPVDGWFMWWYGQDLPGLLDRARVNGARLTVLQAYPDGGRTLFLGVMAANLDPRTQARQLLQAGTDTLVSHGVTGAVAQLTDPVFGTVTVTSGGSDRTVNSPVDPAAHFRIASLSKAFVATLILGLEAQGRLSISDPVDRWLPGQVPGGADITLVQLLNHSSGLYNYTDSRLLPPFLSTMDQSFTPAQLLALAVANPPYFAPGTGYHYSNTNYLLLAMVVEKVTGQPYGQQVMSQLVGPLHLTGTSVPMDSSMPAPLLRGYLDSSDTTAQNPTRWYGAGQLVSTVDDVNAFTSALLSGRVLPPAQLAELKGDLVTVDSTHRYGLGLERTSASCGTTIWQHTGRIPGFESESAHSDSGGRNVVVFYSGSAGTQPAADILAGQAAFCRLPNPVTSAIAGPAGLCLDDPHSSTSAGTQVQLYGCNGTGAQSWTRPGDGTLRAMGLCLDVRGGNPADGTPVQLYTCDGTPAQQWRSLPGGALLNFGTGKCLSTPPGAAAAGTLLDIGTCDGSAVRP